MSLTICIPTRIDFAISTSISGSGAVYAGGYTDSKRNGQGKCIYADGDVYAGEWIRVRDMAKESA